VTVAMDLPTVIAMAVAAVNSVLLGVLVAVWVSNYRQFRTPMVLGLLGFSSVLLLENLVALAFYLNSMRMLYSMDPFVGQVVLGLRLLELVAISFLTYATLK
jgi:ABC-type phosphate transport system permease subunit